MSRLWRLCALLLACVTTQQALASDSAGEPAADAARHSLWSLQGKQNTVYLLGSVHFLSPAEPLPAVMDQAYQRAAELLMELDMDALDPAHTQQVTLALGVLPEGQSLNERLDGPTAKLLQAQCVALTLDCTAFQRLRPWLAGLTVVQVQLMQMGLDPQAGIEQRLLKRSLADGKPIHGLETLEEQLQLLASLPEPQQAQFLRHSLEDAQHMEQDIQLLLTAWRGGDSDALARLLGEGLEQFPALYRSLTTDRNKRWVAPIEALLDKPHDVLVVVGALHLAGEDSVVDLLRRRGHTITQH